MNSAEKWLTCLLRFNALLLLCAIPPIFFPYAWMNAIHDALGLGVLPEAPIVEYLARSASALYVGYGVTALVISLDVRRYAPLITVWGAMILVFSGVILAIDLHAGMPWDWTFGESGYTLVVGSVVLWLNRAARRGSK